MIDYIVKIFLKFLLLLSFGNCFAMSFMGEDDGVPLLAPKTEMMVAGEYFLKVPLGYVMGHGFPATLIILEDDEDITLLSDISSLRVKTDGRALNSIRKRNLFDKSNEGENLNFGDIIELPSQKVKIVEKEDLQKNSHGYEIRGYTSDDTYSPKNNLAYTINVIGGFKKDPNDSGYIPAEEVVDNSVFVATIICRSKNKSVKSWSVYRHFSNATTPSDENWYYEYNGRKIRIEKMRKPLEGKSGSLRHEIFTKRIIKKDLIEEFSILKYRNLPNAGERILRNGRIRRDSAGYATDLENISTLKYGNIKKTKIGALGNLNTSSSEKIALYISDEDADYLRGKEKSRRNADGTWSVFEYHPVLEGNMRKFTIEKGVPISDISGDGEIGIEDLKGTPVEIETRVLVDWMGSRHTKSVKTAKGIATYSENKLDNGFSVKIESETEVSLKYYDHIKNDGGGLIEKITYFQKGSKNQLSEYKTRELFFEGLAMDIPTAVAETNIGTNANSKIITVPDQYVRFNDSGFIGVNGVPNYSNIPLLTSNSGFYRNLVFSLRGLESNVNSELVLPWGRTYIANNFSPVSGKTTLQVLVDLNSSGKPLYEATYVYIDGTFYLTRWTYYKYDTSVYPYDLRGTYKSDNTYCTQSALVNNIREVSDFYGTQSQIYFGGDNSDKAIWIRKKGIISAEYGNQNDFITLYDTDVSSISGCVVSEESGPCAISYFSSPISDTGAPKYTDELLYQTYSFSDEILGCKYKAIDIDKYGIVTRVLGSADPNSEYIFKTIKPGFTASQPHSVFERYNQNGFKYKLTGAGVVSVFYKEYNFSDKSYDSVVGSETSGRIDVVEKDPEGRIVRTANAFGSVNYDYNSEGLLAETTYPDGKTVSNAYDCFGDKISTTTTYFNPATNLDTVIGIPESYNKEYVLENGIVWGVYTSNIEGKQTTTKTRVSGLEGVAIAGLPLTEEAIFVSDNEKILRRVFSDRNAKLKIEKKYKYSIESSDDILRGECIEKYLNEKCVESEIKTFDPSGILISDIKVLYELDDACRISKRKYYAGSSHIFDETITYLPGERVIFSDENNVTKSILSLGRAETKSIGKNGLYYGRKLTYIDRNSKNAGEINSKIYATNFDNIGKPLSGNAVYYKYNDLGRQTHSWGYDQIPKIYVYNEFSEISDMYLFKSSPENITYFSGNDWPASYTVSHADAEHTHWSYDSATGLNTSKTDALNKTIYAVYDNVGRLASLTDPNGNTKTFTYDFAGRRVGEACQNSAYSYSYNNDNKVCQITSGTETYLLEYGANSDMPIREVFADGSVLTRDIDSSGNITRVKLQNGENVLYDVQYAYNTNNLMSSISALGKIISYERGMNGEITNINLDNIASIEYAYDALQRIANIGYKYNNADLIKNSYNYNSAEKISSAFIRKNNADYANWQYAYHALKPGIASAVLYKGALQSEQIDDYANESFDYDLAGNPCCVMQNSPGNYATIFVSNKDNQTTQINRPSDLVYPVRGRTNSNSALNVSINDVSQQYTKPQGESDYIFTVGVFNSIYRYIKLKIEAVLSGAGLNGADAKTMVLGAVCLPLQQENLTYDENGNLTGDGRWIYSWDYRNRLVSMQTKSEAIAAGIPAERYVYTYDHADRKIKVEKYTKSGGGSNFVLYSTNKRYYDNWNLIYETIEYASGESAEVKKYFYGLDLDGALYASGGTGGLRLLEINGVSAFVFNNNVGNIEALYSANASDNSRMLASYEYTAFGTILRQSGELAQKNPIRYSSRYLESNTGFYYYGYRHYSPSMMKWINKDFIAELGGVNLYMFCANNGIYFWDTLGLCAYMHMLNPLEVIELYFNLYHDNNTDRFDAGVKFNTENVCPYIRVSCTNNNYTETIGVVIPIKRGTLDVYFTTDNSNMIEIGLVGRIKF